jgi:hypothetical protein
MRINGDLKDLNEDQNVYKKHIHALNGGKKGL